MNKRLLFIAVMLLMTFQIKAQCWISTATRSHTNYAIKSDGTLWSWGRSDNGQVGNGTLVDQTSPIQIGTDNDWISIRSGASHVFANKSDGTTWGWGRNDHGELGDGTNVEKVVPTLIGTFNYTSFATGANHSLAVKSNGTLWSWGFNAYGELGTGGNSSLVPVQVGLATNWASVYAGETTSFGIKTDGSLWAWGRNQNGQLGNGNTTNQLTPIQIGTATDWESISPGWNFIMALKTDGTMWAWGMNEYGQFGNGNILNSLVPIQSGTANDWASISTGIWHNTAIKNNGTLWVWGSNGSGQLGDGTNTDQTTPLQIGIATNWTSSNAGYNHSLILNADHQLYASGYNVYGQVGIGTIVNVNTFTTLSGSTVTPQFAAINPICSGTSLTLPTTSTDGISGTWSPAFNNAASQTYTFTPNVGCATTTTLAITVNSTPVILTSTPASRCGTGTVVLGASTDVGTLNWYDQAVGGSIIGTGITFTTPTISSATNYYVESINGSCSSARTAVVASVTTTALPTANANQTFCNAGTVGNINVVGTVIKWYDASSLGNLLPTSTMLTNGGIYYASQTVGGCESARIPVTAVVNVTPIPSGISTQDYCKDATIAQLVVAGTNIIWYNNPTSGNVLPTSTPLVAGVTYYASQTIGTCESSSRFAVTVTLDACLGVENISQQDFKLYPNPATEKLTISSTAMMEKLEMTNATGAIVKEQIINATETNIDLSQFDSGIYFVRILAKDGNKTLRFIKK